MAAQLSGVFSFCMNHFFSFVTKAEQKVEYSAVVSRSSDAPLSHIILFLRSQQARDSALRSLEESSGRSEPFPISAMNCAASYKAASSPSKQEEAEIALQMMPRQHYSISSSPFASSIITLIVGGPESPAQEPKAVEFYIHEALLTINSSFFRLMLFRPSDKNGPGESQFCWYEAHTRVVKLPEDRVADWEMMLLWLYSGGNKWNNLSAEVVKKESSEELLESMMRSQPGLEDKELTSAITRCIESRATATRVVKQRIARLTNTLADTSHQELSSLSGLSISDVAQPELKKTTEYDSVLQLNLGNDFVSSRTLPVPWSLASPPQPTLPAFGPLIRLYILADKYDFSPDCHGTSGLKEQIALRLRAVGKTANILPDRYDIERLWDHILFQKDVLKAVIVEMYAGISERSLINILVGVLRRTGSAEEKANIPCLSEWDEGEWHPGFLKELMIRKALSCNCRKRHSHVG